MEEEMKVSIKKYKICKIKPQNEEEFKVFAETIDKIKEWVIEEYPKNNLPTVNYIYSVATIEEAKKYGKQI
jgi:hypothetical protein